MLVLFLSQPAKAQSGKDETWLRYLESWMALQEETAESEEWIEQYSYYIDNPININDTLSDDLMGLFFLSEFQARAIKEYIRQEGTMLSKSELMMVNGLDTATLVLLLPVVTTADVDKGESLSLREILRHGWGILVMGGHGDLEQARGYREEIYEGNGMRMYFRYHFHYKDRVRFQFSGDKDPGEALFRGSQRQGFDFYGGYLQLKNFGRVKQAIVGQYHAQFGQGLTLWSGFAPYNQNSGAVGRYAVGLRPAGVFTEYGYLQGAAAQVLLGRRWKLTLCYSDVDRDATLNGNGEVQSLVENGYHRTATELAKKDVLQEQLAGGRLEYGNSHLQVGLTATGMWFDQPIVPAEHTYNAYAFTGDEVSRGGVDMRARWGKVLLFGEGAWCSSGGLAAIGGMQLCVSNNQQVSVSARDYGKDFYMYHVAPYGQTGGGERGVTLGYEALLRGGDRLMASADCYESEQLRYGVYSPSRGAEYRVGYIWEVSQWVRVFAKYRYKGQLKNASELQTTAYETEMTRRHQAYLSLECKAKDRLRMTTRVGWCRYGREMGKWADGFALGQDLAMECRRIPLSLTARVALFDAEDYEARLYFVENDFVYDCATPALWEQGMRGYLIARYDFGERVTIGVKYAVTQYGNRETAGSGYDEILGSRRRSVKVQVRVNF